MTDTAVSDPSGQQSTVKPSPGSRLGNFIQEPLGSIITASVAVIGSLGVVLSGSWFIHLALN